MRKFFYLVLIANLISITTRAQTIRTDVLVIGGNTFGVAAGIQAAKSGVKAYIIESTDKLGNESLNENITRNTGFSEKFAEAVATKSSVFEAFKSLTDTTKNLKVLLNSTIKSREKSGRKWQIKLTNGTKIIAKAVVDAIYKPVVSVSGMKINDILIANSPDNYYSDNSYRTLVGHFPLKNFVAPGEENLIRIAAARPLANGQAAGATAAYCAFFDTDTKKLDVRVIQGEILGYEGQLVEINDVPQTDSNYLALQRISVTGIFKGAYYTGTRGGFLFRPEEKVKIEDVATLREYFTRSQLWFKDNPNGDLTLEKLLSLIKFTGNRGEELNREVEKAWKSSFKFENAFDLKKQLTRREAAVLIDAYLKPFNTKINLDGRIMN